VLGIYSPQKPSTISRSVTDINDHIANPGILPLPHLPAQLLATIKFNSSTKMEDINKLEKVEGHEKSPSEDSECNEVVKYSMSDTDAYS